MPSKNTESLSSTSKGIVKETVCWCFSFHEETTPGRVVSLVNARFVRCTACLVDQKIYWLPLNQHLSFKTILELGFLLFGLGGGLIAHLHGWLVGLWCVSLNLLIKSSKVHFCLRNGLKVLLPCVQEAETVKPTDREGRGGEEGAGHLSESPRLLRYSAHRTQVLPPGILVQ